MTYQPEKSFWMFRHRLITLANANKNVQHTRAVKIEPISSSKIGNCLYLEIPQIPQRKRAIFFARELLAKLNILCAARFLVGINIQFFDS
jgi:hypothetical protein